MSAELVCWQCGASLKSQPLPLGRRAECLACGAELHVCRLCRHFDTSKAKACRERAADEVRIKTRANFCDWFHPRTDAFIGTPSQTAAPSNPLDSLFGSDATQKAKNSPSEDLENLFRKN